MQSATTRRFAPVPLAAALIVAAGLAGGIIALGVTDNLPGQDGAASDQVAPAVVVPADEYMLNRLQVAPESGTGATLDSALPMIKGVPSIEQGDGLSDPRTSVDGHFGDSSGTRFHNQGDMGFTDESSTYSTENEYVFDPFTGRLLDESSSDTEHAGGPVLDNSPDY